MRFAPTLPDQWTGYRFKAQVRDTLLEVSVDATGTDYRLLRGDVLVFAHAGKTVELNAQRTHIRMENK
nr:glycosyl hydrolase family 65 protein [Telluria mixta]